MLFPGRLVSLRIFSTVAAVASLTLFLTSLFFTYLYQAEPHDVRQHIPSLWYSDARPGRGSDASPGEIKPLPVPDAYRLDDIAEPAFCTDRFSTKYLHDLRDTSFQYCGGSQSRLTCFHSHTREDEERDSTCITTGAVFDESTSRFSLNCSIQEPDANTTARGIIPFEAIRPYWYDTGPRILFDNFMQFLPSSQASLPRAERPIDAMADPAAADDQQAPGTPPRRFVLLVKREGAGNPWHSLLEAWSMFLTFDMLRMARDPADGRAWFDAPTDAANTQVVVLDDHDDGPYFNLWTLYAARPPIRLNQIPGNPEARQFLTGAADLRVIVPLAGSSNPLWQNDWAPRACTTSATLRAFTRRVLETYRVAAEPPSEDVPLRVTLIDRTDANTRRLVRQEALLAALRAAYPAVAVQAVDFGRLPFAEQLRLVQSTDVLVGVHGAGLTHAMFLPEHTAAVVEIQPADMGNVYMGFRNLANMRGLTYVRTMAQPATELAAEEPAADTANNSSSHSSALRARAAWHTENFDLDTDAFVAAVGAAIHAVSNKKLHTNAVA